MMSNTDSYNGKITFSPFLRLVFVVFSLYLTGDAFYRWDGFSYYASFSEFLPAVALAFLMWSIVAVFAALLIWLFFRILVLSFRVPGLRIEVKTLLFYSGVFMLLGILVWKGKKIFWPTVQTTIHIKLTVFVLAAVISAVLSWFFRKQTDRCIEIVQDRIIPLVWLYSICVLIAVPVVAYHAWFKHADKGTVQEMTRPPGVHKKQPNIVLLTFDALAAREMSLYGYPEDTTPFVTEWAKSATVFTRAEAGSNFTTPAVASLMSGKRVWSHQTYHIEGTRPVRSNMESLPYVMKQNGYFNIALVVNPFASVEILGMSGSFDIAPLASEFSKSASLFGWKFGVIDNFLYRTFGEKIRLHNWILRNEFIFTRLLNLVSRNITETTVPPHRVFNKFLEIVDGKMPSPFFAWIHVFPPHDPYLPPESYREQLRQHSVLNSYKSQEKLIEESYTYLFKHQSIPEEMEPAVGIMREKYDEFIKYIDSTFQNFIHELNKRRLDNTIIILSADHGESFEHGYFTHGGPFLYEQVTHIPLIIKEPGQDRGRIIRDNVEQVDIAASILELANTAVPSWMDGRSFVPLMRGEQLPGRPVFSMNLQENRSRGHQIGTGSIAVWEDDYKLIHYLEKGESLLFDLKQDPGELNNLFNKEPETGERLFKILMKNLDLANKNIANNK